MGRAVVRRLAQEGADVTLVSRRPKDVAKVLRGEMVRAIGWDAHSFGDWVECLNGADLVANLVGQSIAGRRWTQQYKDLLWRSRVDTTRLLVSSMARLARPPALLVQASAVGYYGSQPTDDPVDETWPAGTDYLARLCSAWEAEAMRAAEMGVRVVILRFGVVLHPEGGALKPMIAAFRWFLGGPLGSGRQWFPWIHWDDVSNLALWAINNRAAASAYNAVAPEAVTMLDFCHQLGKAMGRPCWLPVPKVALRILLGEGAEAALGGVRAVPARLLREGYSFLFPDLSSALRSMFRA